MITIAETPPFVKKALKILSSKERSELISYLSIHPKVGVIIEGSGGIRKLRWARSLSKNRKSITEKLNLCDFPFFFVK